MSFFVTPPQDETQEETASTEATPLQNTSQLSTEERTIETIEEQESHEKEDSQTLEEEVVEEKDNTVTNEEPSEMEKENDSFKTDNILASVSSSEINLLCGIPEETIVTADPVIFVTGENERGEGDGSEGDNVQSDDKSSSPTEVKSKPVRRYL